MHSTGGVEEPRMLVSIIAALLLAVLGPHVQVVDDRGTPVAGAKVIFRSAAGATATVTTDTAGDVAAPDDFDAVSVTVNAAGFDPTSIPIPAAKAAIVLHAQSTVIGKVSVATGSARNLHRLAVPAASLDRTSIATTPVFATDALLRALPGFDFVRSNSAFTAYGNLRVSFSGAGEDRGLVLADDIPAQDGFGGQVDWLAYPPASLSSVELLRGPGAALYGANAIGGVLQLRSFGPGTDWRALPSGGFELQDGTPHRTNATLNYRFTVAPNLTAAVSTQTGHQAYFDLPPTASPLGLEATTSSSATRAQMRYTFGNSSVTAGGLFANDEQFEGRPSYTFARDSTQADLHFATSTAATSLGVAAYNRDTNITNTNDLAPANPGSLRYVQQIPTRESGVAASWFLTRGDNEVAVRADEKFVYGISTQTGPTGALQSQGTGKQQYAGLALEDTYEHGRVQVIGGLRGDLVATSEAALRTASSTRTPPARTDRVLSPRLAARYDVTPSIALRASAGGGFREPFLNELVRGYRIGSIAYNPNPNLTAERSSNYGFGADALLGPGRLALDFATTKVNNAIAFLTASPTSQTRSNVDRTQTDSTTLTYTTRLARCTRLRGYLTSQYARIIKGPAADLGNRLQYVPSRSGDIAVESGSGAFSYGADVGYAGVTFADDLNTQVLPAAVLVGAHITRPLGQGASLTLEGSNLTGTRYLSSPDRYGPPPSIGLRMRFGLGPQGPDAGTPTCP
jgi:outer membrane receptor protein involved in Fe transport